MNDAMARFRMDFLLDPAVALECNSRILCVT
jgi:hypothetical protein